MGDPTRTNIFTWLNSRKRITQGESCLLGTARKVWLRYVQGNANKYPYSPLLPLSFIPKIRKIMHIHDISVWAEMGIDEIRDLYIDNTLMSFQEMVDTYNIPQAHFLKYTAIRKAITQQWGDSPSEPLVSPVLHAILSHGNAKKMISYLYIALRAVATPSLSDLWERWEADLSTPLSDAKWNQALCHVKEISRNMRLRYTQINYLHRTYLTLPTALPECTRELRRNVPDAATTGQILYIWYGPAQYSQ